MPFELPNLPYPLTALAPHVSAATLEVHHGKHHRAYVEKTHLLLAGHGRLAIFQSRHAPVHRAGQEQRWRP